MRLALAACCLVAACATPSPRFLGQAPLRLASGGHHFALYRKGAEAELVRERRIASQGAADVATAAIRAAEHATGCTVAWLRGDTAIMQVGLACGSLPAPPPPEPPLEFDCEALGVYTRPGTGLSDITLDCWTP